MSLSYSVAATLNWDTNADLDLYGEHNGSVAWWGQPTAGNLQLNDDAHPECLSSPLPPEIISSISDFTDFGAVRFWYNRYSDCGVAPGNVTTSVVIHNTGDVNIFYGNVRIPPSGSYQIDDIFFVDSMGDQNTFPGGTVLNFTEFPPCKPHVDVVSESCSCNCCDTCGEAGSQAGVHTSNGGPEQSLGTISAPRFGLSSAFTLSYASRLMDDEDNLVIHDYGLGNNWMPTVAPYLCQKEETVVITFGPYSAYWFDLVEGDYVPRYGAKVGLTHDDGEHTFNLSLQESGARYTLADKDHPTSPPGALVSITSAGGLVYTVTTYSADGLPIDYQQTETDDDCDCVTPVTIVFRTLLTTGAPTSSTTLPPNYEPPVVGEGEPITSILQLRQVNGGPWIVLSQTILEHYGENDAQGNPGDLKFFINFHPQGTEMKEVGRSLMTYYKDDAGGIGFESGLKFILDPEAWRRLTLDSDFIDAATAPDSLLAKYADNYYEYDGDHRATRSKIEAGTKDYQLAYATPPSPFSEDYNHWQQKTTTTRPDGSTLTVWVNHVQEPMLTRLADADEENEWLNYFRYEEVYATRTMHAHPSAVVSFDEEEADLDVTLREDAGLIETTDYYDTTGGGAAEGYVQHENLQEGETGTPIKQLTLEYSSETAGDATIFPVSRQTRYRDDAGTEPIHTNFAHTFWPGTVQVLQKTTTLPVVPSSQNGDEETYTQVEQFDIFGNLTWTKSPRGFIGYQKHDLATGAVVQSISDVDMAQMGDLPDKPEWTTPEGGGLHLVTDMEVDAWGRTGQTLGPPRDANGTMVRTASWTVYLDAEHEIRTATGYATAMGAPGEYQYTLTNPVSISKMDHAGRTVDAVTAVRASTQGKLTGADEFPQATWCRWTHTIYADDGDTTETLVYHSIPASGEGQKTVNYDATKFGYDLMGRQNKSVTPAGTISRTVFDVRGFAVSTWIGTNDSGATDDDPTGGGAPGNNMVQIVGNVYDDGSDGGDGNLTETTAHVDGSTTRVTTFEFDFRNRQTVTEGEENFCQENVYDNLNHAIQVNRYDGTTGGNLIGRSETLFDDRARTYRTLVYAVDVSTGTPGDALVDNTWYDAEGNPIKNHPASSEAFVKSVFDGVGRRTVGYIGYYSGSGGESPDSVTNDVIFDQTETEYDAASNVIFVTSRQRWHDATGNGPLNGPEGEQPKSRDSYMATWYDGANRQIAVGNYGTNDNARPLERPNSPPESTDDVLVSHVRYNERGETFETVDPTGVVSRTETDDAGRAVVTIQNYVPCCGDELPCPGNDVNVTTHVQHLHGHMIALIAKNSETGDQETRYQFGVTLEDSDLASNDLLRAEVYPDSKDANDRVLHSYNRQNEQISKTDQNGTIHEFVHDGLGRPTEDKIVEFGEGVDDTVQRIGVTYEVRGLVEKITSFDAPTGGSPVNEVQNGYNDLGQLAVQYQEHNGAVNTGTSLKVEYAHDLSASAGKFTKGARATQVEYPDGKELDLEYGSGGGTNDKLGRVENLTFDSTNVCQYTRLGLNTIVGVDYPQANVRYNLATGDGANPYASLDRYSRIIDLLWENYSGSPVELVRLQYGYGRASNRMFRKDLVATANGKHFDELYKYDRLHRLKKFHRGLLVDNNAAIINPALQQGWNLDATGNWRNFLQNDQTDANNTIDQERLHNWMNEITNIAREVGPAWATPEYDRNGNMTVIPQLAAMDNIYKSAWDAWNRLVHVKTGDDSSVARYVYDGLNRRIVKFDDRLDWDTLTLEEWGSLTEGQWGSLVLSEVTAERHFYFSNQWQVIEERTGNTPESADPDRQYVWGLRYIDDLVLRDRSVESVLDERLYAMQDANWNVVGITNTSGAVQERYVYTPYGVCQVLAPNFDPREATEFDWTYRFTGHEHDLETGLDNFRKRPLHTVLGIFIGADVAGYADGMNLYRAYFVPNKTDPFGLQAVAPQVVKWFGSDAVYLDAGFLDLSFTVIPIIPGVLGIDVNIVGGIVYLVNCRSLEDGFFAYFGGGIGISLGISPGFNQAVNVGVGFVWNLPGPIATTYAGTFFNASFGGGVGLATAYALGPAAALGGYVQGFAANPLDFFGARTKPYGFEFGWKGTLLPSIGVSGTVTYYWTIKTWRVAPNHFLIRTLCCPKGAFVKPANNAAAAREVRKMASVMLAETKKYEALIKNSAANEGRKYLRQAVQTTGDIRGSIIGRAAQGNVDVQVGWGQIPEK